MAAPYRITQNGTDDISDQVSLESVEVIEAGPGGVSSMTFTIDDIAKTITVAKYDEFRWINQVGSDVMVFRGYAVGRKTTYLGIGRQIEVECVGLDVLLDWLVGTSVTVLAATNFPVAVNQIAINKTSNWDADVHLTLEGGGSANPIGTFDNGLIPFLTGGTDWTVPRSPVRQQVEALNEMCSRTGPLSFGVLCTVDFDFRFRCFEDDITVQPSDWTTLTLDNDAGVAGTTTEGLEVETDWRSTIDRVRVVGTAEAWVGSTAFPRHEAVIENADLNTANERTMAGEAYLLAHAPPDRGTFSLTHHAPTLSCHAGGLLDLTDTVTGATGTYRISQITKRFYNDSREDWDVTYGRLPPSAMRQIRGLTRGVSL